MTIFTCRIDTPNYSIYDFLDELKVGYKEFESMDKLKEHIEEHLLNEEDKFLHPDDLGGSGLTDDSNIYLFIIDTRTEMNWIVKISATMEVTDVKLPEVENKNRRKVE